MSKEFPYKTQPFYARQREILTTTCNLPYAYLDMEQGTGKTWVSINTMAFLYLTKRINAAIVIAPNGVHTAWATEQIPQHMPDPVPAVPYVWRSSDERGRFNKAKKSDLTLAEQRESWDVWQLVMQKDVFPILCMNSEAITIPLAEKAVMAFLLRRKCLLIVDEAGEFTQPSAERVRQLMRWRRRAPYRRLLEGVPAQSPLELYTPFRFLHEGILGFPTFATYKDYVAEWVELERNNKKFKVVKSINGKKVWKWDNLKVIRAKIAPHMHRVTKAEALPFLPKKQFHKLYFSMTKEQWRLTNELRENLITELTGGGTVSTEHVITQYLRFQQIACGYVPPDVVYGEEPEPARIIPGPNPRLEACIQELLRYGGRSTIIWTRFQFDIDVLGDRLRSEGFTFVTYDGRTSPAEREDAKLKFQTGEAQVFLGNAAAGGRGLNLYRAQHEIFYANYFGLRKRLQAEDRGHRIGSSLEYPVTICDLVGDHSIDLMIVRALRNSQEVADVITGDPHKDWI